MEEQRVLPQWVSNEKKYERAKAVLKKEGKELTEDAIKELYIKYGGLVITEEMIAEERVVEEAPIIPSRRGGRRGR